LDIVAFGDVDAVDLDHPLMARGFHAFHLSLL